MYIYKTHPRKKAIMSWDFSATGRQHSQSVAAKEHGEVIRTPSSGEEPPPLVTSTPQPVAEPHMSCVVNTMEKSCEK
jgi:hypothetical protein